MAENTKQLKVEAIFDTRGAEKVLKASEDLRKVYTELGRIVKDLGKEFRELDSIQQRRQQSQDKELESVKKQIDALRRKREELVMLERVSQGGALRATSSGGGNVGVGGGGNFSGNGANYNGPVGGGGFLSKAAGFLGKAAPIMGYVGAGVSMIGGAVSAYGDYQQHAGRAEQHEKFMGMENLARSQSYRNHMFMESRQAPIGFTAYKHAYNFNVKSKNSDMVTVDAKGNIIQPGGDQTDVYSGSALQGRAQNMHGAYQESQGKITSGQGHMISAAGKGISGMGVLAGAASGAALGFGLGGPIGAGIGGVLGGVAASGGVGAIVGAIKEGTAAYFQVHHEEKKLREGELEAQQSEEGVKMDKLKDEVLAITRYQMGVLSSNAGTMSSVDRSSLGFEGYARGQTDFDRGESYSVVTGARRGYGSVFDNYKTKKGTGNALSSVFEAGRRGMNMGVATDVIGAFGSTSSGKEGAQQLEKLMQMAVKHGMESVDMGFFEKLAGAAAKQHFSQTSGVNSNAAAALMFSGLYKPNQYQVQNRTSGLAAGDRLFTENSYFRSRGMVDAASVLGNNANGARVSALAGASMAELMADKNGNISERLMAGGINATQAGAYKKKRLQGLGDVLGGYDDVKKLIGGKDFDSYLQDLGGRLGGKNKKDRAAAQKELNTLSFYGSALTGEQFGDLQGALGAYGASAADLKGLKGGMPWQRRGGQASAIVATQNRMHNTDIKGGKDALNDVETSKALIDFKKNQGFMNAMLKEDPDMVSRWTKDPAKHAAEIKMKHQQFQGNAAAGTGPGYESTQELNKALGATVSLLNNEVAIALKNFAKNLDARETRKAKATEAIERHYNTDEDGDINPFRMD